MSNYEPGEPYVYQAYGMQDEYHWKRKEIYGVGGIGLAEVKGLTNEEAIEVAKIFKKTRSQKL